MEELVVGGWYKIFLFVTGEITVRCKSFFFFINVILFETLESCRDVSPVLQLVFHSVEKYVIFGIVILNICNKV